MSLKTIWLTDLWAPFSIFGRPGLFAASASGLCPLLPIHTSLLIPSRGPYLLADFRTLQARAASSCGKMGYPGASSRAHLCREAIP
jgi:hypothetical protein